MLKVRAFRAVDNIDSCRLFAEGHANVLRDFGITKVTSSRNDWFYNPEVFVATVESDDGRMLGGERIHLVNKDMRLPIEDAVTIVDKKIHGLVADYAAKGITGELCGLWNAREIAGKGVSMLLTKLGVAMANMIGMDSLFVLCAPYTVSMCQTAGFEIETSIGNEGTFIYPMLDLIATALVIKDVSILTNAEFEERKQIFSLIENPVSFTKESGPKGEIEVEYDIKLPKYEFTI
jgi:hypothetical protein